MCVCCAAALAGACVATNDCAMAPTATATCSVEGCGREGRNGKAAKGKYCDRHIPEGIAAGSITSHKRRATSPELGERRREIGRERRLLRELSEGNSNVYDNSIEHFIILKTS